MLKCISFNENGISIIISLKTVLRGPIDDKSTVIKVVAWSSQAASSCLNSEVVWH